MCSWNLRGVCRWSTRPKENWKNLLNEIKSLLTPISPQEPQVEICLHRRRLFNRDSYLDLILGKSIAQFTSLTNGGFNGLNLVLEECPFWPHSDPFDYSSLFPRNRFSWGAWSQACDLLCKVTKTSWQQSPLLSMDPHWHFLFSPLPPNFVVQPQHSS